MTHAELIDAMSEFTRAAFKLCEAAEIAQRDESVASALCVEYPFSESFDETVFRIAAWRDAVRKSLRVPA